MWVLEQLQVAGATQLTPATQSAVPVAQRFFLSAPAGGSVSLGRPLKTGEKQADIVVSGDTSVSKVHAQVLLSQGPAGSAPLTAQLQDLSRFGTFVNSTKMAQGSDPAQLNDGDVLRLGSTRSCFRVRCQPVVLLAPDKDSSSELAEAAQTAASLGMRWDTAWTPHQVTHVLLDQAPASQEEQPTAAQLCAQLHSLPCVTAAWVQQVAARKVHAGSLPEGTVLPPYPHDRSLLHGLTFSVMPGVRQGGALQEIIRVLGGEVSLLEPPSLSPASRGKGRAKAQQQQQQQLRAQPGAILVLPAGSPKPAAAAAAGGAGGVPGRSPRGRGAAKTAQQQQQPPQAAVTEDELLVHLGTGDREGLLQVSGALQGPSPGKAAQPVELEDSDVTREADEDEDGEVVVESAVATPAGAKAAAAVAAAPPAQAPAVLAPAQALAAGVSGPCKGGHTTTATPAKGGRGTKRGRADVAAASLEEGPAGGAAAAAAAASPTPAATAAATKRARLADGHAGAAAAAGAPVAAPAARAAEHAGPGTQHQGHGRRGISDDDDAVFGHVPSLAPLDVSTMFSQQLEARHQAQVQRMAEEQRAVQEAAAAAKAAAQAAGEGGKGKKRGKQAQAAKTAGEGGFDAATPWGQAKAGEEVQAPSLPPTVEHRPLIVHVPRPLATPDAAVTGARMASGSDEQPNFKLFRKAAVQAQVHLPRMVPVDHFKRSAATEAFLKEEERRRQRTAKADALFNAHLRAKKK